MKRWIQAAPILSAVLFFAGPALATTSGDQALVKFGVAWDKVNSYTCTIVAHEVSGSKVQDRTYDFWFQKPHSTRMNITAGDGRGSAIIWDGSAQAYGHQGGLLAMFKRRVDLHDKLATTIRGKTVAEANFGSILDHIRGLKGSIIDSTVSGGKTTINVAVANPGENNSVTREMVALDENGLPTDYDQWEGDKLVEHVSYSNTKLNVTIDPSVFTKL
jgi:outer membrane lipoprotein-sorting protein